MEVWISGVLIPVVLTLVFIIFDKEVKAFSRIIRRKPFESTVIVCLLTIITLLTVYVV